MRTSTTLLLGVMLSVGTMAAPTSTPTTLTLLDTFKTQNIPATWHVSNYSQGCSPAGCVYQFTLSKSAVNNTDGYAYSEPAFSTACNGTNIQDKLVPCANPAITTNSVPGISNATIVVQHMWSQNLTGGPDAGTGIFWIVGNVTLEGFPFPTEFDVPQLESYAIA